MRNEFNSLGIPVKTEPTFVFSTLTNYGTTDMSQYSLLALSAALLMTSHENLKMPLTSVLK